MIIPAVKILEIHGAEYATCARVTLESVLTVRQEDYLRDLLNTFYSKKIPEFSRICFQVTGSVILFRIVSVPRLRNPTLDEISEVLSAMSLVAEPKPSPRQRNRSKTSMARGQAEVHV